MRLTGGPPAGSSCRSAALVSPPLRGEESPRRGSQEPDGAVLLRLRVQDSCASFCWFLRQRIPALMKPSMSPSKTDCGLPDSNCVRRSLTIV